jgi:hypothetical protein
LRFQEAREVKLHGLEGFGSHAFLSLSFQHEFPALRFTTKDFECAGLGIDVPDVKDAARL